MGYSWESQKEIDHREDLDDGGRITLKIIFEKYDDIVWTGFIRLGIRTSAWFF
jgi:hypothetical protein